MLKYFGKKLNSTITTHAIFKGVPLISDNKILQVYKNTLVIRIEDKQLITAFKESPWILKISQDINIKGTVVHLEKEKRYLFLKDLHRVIHNYNLRKAIRYKPEEAVDVIMTIDSKTITMPLIDISEHAFKVTTDNQVIVDKIITHPTTIQTQIILDGKKIQLKSHSMIEPRIVNAKADIIMGYSSNEMNLTLLKDWRNARQLEIIKEVHNFKKNLI